MLPEVEEIPAFEVLADVGPPNSHRQTFEMET